MRMSGFSWRDAVQVKLYHISLGVATDLNTFTPNMMLANSFYTAHFWYIQCDQFPASKMPLVCEAFHKEQTVSREYHRGRRKRKGKYLPLDAFCGCSGAELAWNKLRQ